MKELLCVLVMGLAGLAPVLAAETNNLGADVLAGTHLNPTGLLFTSAAGSNATPRDLPWALSATKNSEKSSFAMDEVGNGRGGGVSLMRSLGATVFVLGLLFAANYWLRKRGGRLTPAGRGARLRIVERVAIDHRRSILLVEADGESLVVAAGTERIETLAVLPHKVAAGEVVS
jgi:flagellar biogenesis protein FliO